MKKLPVRKDRRHTLDIKAFHFILKLSPVNHFMGEVGPEQGQHIEGLNHVRAISTGKGNIGFQADGPLDPADTLSQHLIGQILSFPVGIENRKKKGRKFMPGRNSSESNPCRLPIFQKVEREGAVFFVFMTESRRGRDKIVRKFMHPGPSFIILPGMNQKDIVPCKGREDLTNLIQYIFIYHM